MRVRRDELEATLLAGLQEQVLREDVIDYVLEKFESGLLKELGKMSRELDKMQRRKGHLEKELGDLVTALAAGQSSPTIMQAIADREREISAITERAVSSTENSIKARIDKMRVAAKGEDERSPSATRAGCHGRQGGNLEARRQSHA